ncbi:MAG: deoxyribose-phosphate aldolase [Firmicutes bacterium HGW-Firmicutes-1]|nr:MAG: deoxyribose-phosphate aldolase [Firmicutes bacterium HGW-Firmicutes-1]
MNIASMIDHTVLKADATVETVTRLCEEAKEYGFASVCVNSCHVKLVSKLLSGSISKTCCVVGFPLGAMLSTAKAFETAEAIRLGAEEIDTVINIGAVKDGDYELVYEDIKAVVVAADKKAIVKVIIETCLLTDEEKVKVCELCVKAGADFVKTSTGFSAGGATAADVALMKKTVEGKALVKASGGVRTVEDMKAVIAAGADRIGTSNGIGLVTGK